MAVSYGWSSSVFLVGVSAEVPGCSVVCPRWCLASPGRSLKSATYWLTAPGALLPLPSEGSRSSASLGSGMWQVECTRCSWTWQLHGIKSQLWALLLNDAVFFPPNLFQGEDTGFASWQVGFPCRLCPLLKACEKVSYFCGFFITSCQAVIISVGGTSLAVYWGLWLLLCQTM